MKSKSKPSPKAKRMKPTLGIGGVVILAGIGVAVAYTFSGSHEPPAGAPPSLVSGAVAADTSSTDATSQQMATALQRAAGGNKTLFTFVFEKNDEATAALRKTVESTLAKLGDQVQLAMLDRTDPAEKSFVSKHGLDRAPMPLVLAIAPNGAITGGFPAEQVSESRVRDALASPCFQQCLKSLQERRLVMVCLQNSGTQGNTEAMKGVNDFKASSQYGSVTDVVKVDPSDPKEIKLLTQLKADPQAKVATTAFLAPPGVLVAKVEGPTTKEDLAAALQKAMSACATGAGSSCCPAPKK